MGRLVFWGIAIVGLFFLVGYIEDKIVEKFGSLHEAFIIILIAIGIYYYANDQRR